MKRTPCWVVLRYTGKPTWVCNRCKVERPAFMPASTRDVIKQGEAFSESHKKWKKVA